jgi:ssDNA thymidine ADP-ribosyltransferase, DarT
MSALNPEKALLFRITHIANVPWMLDHGLHCRNSPDFDPSFRNVGNPDLIARRHHRVVPVAPGGTLSDYVPFYFTPYSIMLYNIKTGYGGVPRQPNDQIVILVSSLRKVAELGLGFVFTNQHAYPLTAQYFNTLGDLGRVDWPLLQARDFRHDPEDPGKKERYQAEALIHRHLPLAGLLGIGCYSDAAQQGLQTEIQRRNLSLQAVVRPGWYF